MSNPTTLFGRLFLGLIILALQIDVSFATSIEDVLTSLKGLSQRTFDACRE